MTHSISVEDGAWGVDISITVKHGAMTLVSYDPDVAEECDRTLMHDLYKSYEGLQSVFGNEFSAARYLKQQMWVTKKELLRLGFRKKVVKRVFKEEPCPPEQ